MLIHNGIKCTSICQIQHLNINTKKYSISDIQHSYTNNNPIEMSHINYSLVRSKKFVSAL